MSLVEAVSHPEPSPLAARQRSSGRPLRTLLFSTLYPSSARPSHGIFVETRLRELLSSGQVETKVVAPVPWFWSTDPRHGEYARMAATPGAERRHGIDVRHPRYLVLPKVGMTLAPLLLAMASVRAIQQLIDEGFDFDLIDAHYYYPDGVAAAWLARHFKRPLTITARGTDLNLIPQYTLPRRMIQWAAGRADASIGVCAALVDVLRQWQVPAGRLHVMRNGVDLQRFAPLPPAQVRAELGVQGQPVLLSVGHLIERKGHHLTIGALPRLREVHPGLRLYLIGEGEQRAALEALARQLGVADAVTFVGAVPNDQLSRWYSAADVSILASSREGWANVLLESMACGTPVVATRVWGTPEVIDRPEAGQLVPERSAQGMAEGVLALLAQAPARQAVRRHAEGFSWAATTQAQLAVFGGILEQRHA